MECDDDNTSGIKRKFLEMDGNTTLQCRLPIEDVMIAEVTRAFRTLAEEVCSKFSSY